VTDSSIEHSLRKHVEERGRSATGWSHKATTSPTALMITSKIQDTIVTRISSQRGLNRPMNPFQREWLAALGSKPGIFIGQPRAGRALKRSGPQGCPTSGDALAE
jgi:hypothetical protein